MDDYSETSEPEHVRLWRLVAARDQCPRAPVPGDRGGAMTYRQAVEVLLNWESRMPELVQQAIDVVLDHADRLREVLEYEEDLDNMTPEFPCANCGGIRLHEPQCRRLKRRAVLTETYR